MLLKRYKLHSSIFFAYLYQSKGNCSITSTGSFTGQIVDINIKEGKFQLSLCFVLLKGLIQAEKVNGKLDCVFLKEVNDLGISGDLFCEVNNMMRGIHEYKQSTRQREPWLFHKERVVKARGKITVFFSYQ